MPQGSRRVTIRLEPELEKRVMDSISSNNLARRESEYDLSGWIRQAIEERLAKLKRSRRKKVDDGR